MLNRQKCIFIGVDTHKFTHTAVIVNCWGDKLGAITFENKPSAFMSLLEEVKKHTKRGFKAVYGLEDCGGVGRALAVFLLQNEKTVKEVLPSLANIERKGLPIYHKDDHFDALCIARVMLNRLNDLRDASPNDLYWTINQLCMRRESLVKTSSILKRQLHVHISIHYPSYSKFFSEIDGKTAMAFWEKYPSKASLKNATLEELFELLSTQSHNFFPIAKAGEILEMVESDGTLEVPEFQHLRDFIVTGIVKEIKYIEEEIASVDAKLKTIVDGLDFKLKSMNGIDTVIAANLIGEIGDIRRFPTPDKLAKYSGVSPITYSSAQKERQYKSRQGNRRLYGLFHLVAIQQIMTDRNTNKPRNPVFYEYYKKKISEGKTSGQAVVCIARRLVNIVWGMMMNKTEYIMPTVETPTPERKKEIYTYSGRKAIPNLKPK